MHTEILAASQPEAISRAIETLAHDGLVAFPTDTVYGVGALIDRPAAIEKLYLVKERPRERAIPVLLGSPDQLDQVGPDPGPVARKLAVLFWPGPLTLVVPRHPWLPDILAPGDTVGVRMPEHATALALLNAAGPLAVTSANLSGAANTRTAQEVLEHLGGRIPLVVDGGRTPGGRPSTVVDCTRPELPILREGPIPHQDLLRAIA
jgi:L-threonylcarbamoyladenylate synthase